MSPPVLPPYDDPEAPRREAPAGRQRPVAKLRTGVRAGAVGVFKLTPDKVEAGGEALRHVAP